MAHSNKLVIVESPTKAKKIQGYLGPDYTVLASVGHIRDLAQPSQVPASKKEKFGRFGVDINDGFEPYYIVSPEKKRTVAELKSALSKADELFLATDEDREGEAIAWHLVQTLKPKVPVHRMVFHEITKKAIVEAIASTRDVDQNMVNAQETRRILDRLYGYELSPVLWRKVGPKLSAGRVQSVATRLIVEREKERMAFVPATYRDITAVVAPVENEAGADATTGAAEDLSFEARMTGLNNTRLARSNDFTDKGELTDKARSDNPVQLSGAEADELAQQLQNADFSVTSIEKKLYTRRSAAPFTTSTLQQAAGNRLGFSSRVTMRAAQTLYENGYITYMRTDSIILSNEAIQAAREQVAERFGNEYLTEKPHHFANHGEGVQEAHEAIRPAGSHFRAPEEIAAAVSPTELRLYTLIWQRTLSTQMAPATGSTQTVKLVAPTSKGDAEFQASGTVITFPGFLRVYGDGEKAQEKETRLPQMQEGEITRAVAPVEAVEHQTQPPARYTEASLVKTLEAKEIGRPSTYASIISTIIDRGYVYEKGRALIPSWLAFSVTRLLEGYFPTLVDYEFTAQMEKGLDQIASGKETSLEWLTAFYFGHTPGSVSNPQEANDGLQAQLAQLPDIDAHEINTVPLGEGINVRVGRFGPYVEDTADLDSEGNPRRASVPADLAPDELTVAKARELLAANAGGARVLGTDAQGNTIEVRTGRFGPYVAQVSPDNLEGSDDKKSKKDQPKPKMASLFKSMTPESVTLEQAIQLLSLPRVVGTYEKADEKTGELIEYTVEANNGRYGPYLTQTSSEGKKETRTLESEDAIFTETLEQAQAAFAQPRYRRGRGTAKPPLKEFGNDPTTGKPVVVKDGFYGAYITDGTTNRTVPRQFTVESLTAEDAFRLLAEKREAGPATKRRTSRKSAARGAAAKGSASQSSAARKASTTKKTSTAKKSSTKSSTAKKASTRTTSTRTKSTSATKASTGE